MSAQILVIDDAATVRMYHRKMLGDAGPELIAGLSTHRWAEPAR